jgi:hypothetical protein
MHWPRIVIDAFETFSHKQIYILPLSVSSKEL